MNSLTHHLIITMHLCILALLLYDILTFTKDQYSLPIYMSIDFTKNQ